MDDLSNLEWSSTSSAKSATKPPLMPTGQTSFYSSLRPTPSPQNSTRRAPFTPHGSGNAAKPAAPKAPADSFSNLVNFGGAKSNANLSMRERQEQMEAERRRNAEEQNRKMQAQYGGIQFLDNFGQSSSNPSRTVSPAFATPGSGTGSLNGQKRGDEDDDLFAAFNKDTKVDNSSHYPPPMQQSSRTTTPANTAAIDLSNPVAWNTRETSTGNNLLGDDDPFELNGTKAKTIQSQYNAPAGDDDDFLGDLGRPVEEVRRKAQVTRPTHEPGKPIEDSDSDSEPEPSIMSGSNIESMRTGGDPFDKAVAELVEMGFSPENARRGLTESGAGLNVQAAVGWLLDEAHNKTREKQKPRGTGDDSGRARNNRSPAWDREERPEPPSRWDNRSPGSASGDITQKAAAVGSSLFKTANTLWKTSQKQVQKAVAEFNQDAGDSNQPKWMRSAQQDTNNPSRSVPQNATDEAIMLESGSRPERPARAPRATSAGSFRDGPMRDHSPALSMRPSATPRWQQQSSQSSLDPRGRVTKQAVEEQSAQAYVSPARRKKTPQPQLKPAPAQGPDQDLLFGTTVMPTSQSHPQPAQPSPALSMASPRPITPRPSVPARQIPNVSPSVIQASTRHRLEGTAHFKRGDYDAAHNAYSNSLQGIPQMHPLCIVLLTNRALTALKTGSPKQAVEDADNALKIIGPSHSEGEQVALGDEQRDMKELYGKALSRKAEALEQMERWADAGEVWKLCVEAGVSSATASAGRQRCQKALAPKPAPRPPQPPKSRPKPSAASNLAPQKDSEAVQRLREANKAAEKADDEKFALSDRIDARIAAWRDGKSDNLRALIGSLDQVLWEGSGWKKVGLHELVMANKVKIHYMKAIAKCHPDKLSQDVSTEVKLVAATVFATLNESWDKFKAENNL